MQEEFMEYVLAGKPDITRSATLGLLMRDGIGISHFSIIQHHILATLDELELSPVTLI